MALLKTKTKDNQSKTTPARGADFSFVLKHPHITEKASNLAQLNQYTFAVQAGISKTIIRQAVERKYKVHVTKVHTVHLPAKTRRIGRTLGTTPALHKAIVTLREGETIDIATT